MATKEGCLQEHILWTVGEDCSDCKAATAIFGCSDCLLLFCKDCSREHCCCEDSDWMDTDETEEIERNENDTKTE